MTSRDVFGVRIDDLSLDEVRARFLEWLAGDTTRIIVTPNPEFLLLARKSETFRKLLNSADLAIPDGVGLRFAVAALTESRLRNRVTGVDALSVLTSLAAQSEHRIKLLMLGNDAADVDAGRVDGGVGEARLRDDVVEQVRLSAPAIVAVGLGQGKQETIMVQHRNDWPSVKILIGVGGAIDMLTGRRRRAPVWMRKIGLEWLWRLTVEPQRWRRIFRATVVFPAVVVWTTLRERRFLRACKNTIPEIFRQLLGR